MTFIQSSSSCRAPAAVSNSHLTPSSFPPHTANTWSIYTGGRCIPCHQYTLPDHRSESLNKLNNHLVPRAVCASVTTSDEYLFASLTAWGPANEILFHPLAFLASIHAERLGSLEDVKMEFRVQIFFRDHYLWRMRGKSSSQLVMQTRQNCGEIWSGAHCDHRAVSWSAGPFYPSALSQPWKACDSGRVGSPEGATTRGCLPTGHTPPGWWEEPERWVFKSTTPPQCKGGMVNWPVYSRKLIIRIR